MRARSRVSSGDPGPRTRSRLTAALAALVCLLAAVAAVLVGMILTRGESPTTLSARDEVAAITKRFAVFLGDGSTQGLGASSPNARWVSRLAAQEGWEPSNLGKGGTGYTVASGPDGCGSASCPNFQDMVPLALVGSPDVVVVSGGRADLPAFLRDPEKVTVAIRSTFAELRLRLPNARLVAVGPVSPSKLRPDLGRLDAAIQAGVEASAGTFVRVSDLEVPTDEPDDLRDGKLTDVGHAALAARIESALAGE